MHIFQIHGNGVANGRFQAPATGSGIVFYLPRPVNFLSCPEQVLNWPGIADMLGKL